MTKGYKIIANASGVVRAKLFFTEYPSTRNRGYLLKVVGVMCQKGKLLFYGVMSV